MSYPREELITYRMNRAKEEDIVTQWLSDVKGFVALIEQLISQQ